MQSQDCTECQKRLWTFIVLMGGGGGQGGERETE